jgi:MutS-like protein
MFVIVPVLLVVSAVFSAWWSWRWRSRLLTRIRSEWGGPRDRSRDMDAVADFFRSNAAAGGSLDDRTWDDLLMDDMFAHLDRTESSVGQQVLYRRLRQAAAPKTVHAFEALITVVSDTAAVRERAQTVLARLQSPSAYYVHRLAQPDALERQRWHVVFPLWSAAVVLTLSMAFFWPVLLFAAIFGVVVNRVILGLIARRFGSVIVWFRQVGPLFSAARELAVLGTGETAAITGSLASDLSALRRLGGIARWVSRDPLATDTLTFVALEFLNMLFLMDANALYFAVRELQVHAPHLLRVIETVGEIDAAIAVASFRAGEVPWTRPSLSAADAPSSFLDLRHPLVDDAVPNSIALAPPHGVLVTGSNMSGKSTFLRTVGVNVVLAQSLNTCLARAYRAPVYQVRSCIGRADDLIAGKSYYLVEVESVLALVKASESAEPHLFVFDELFRGTNAVERIAAGEAVLHALVSDGRPHVVLTATHDAELVDLLRDVYDVYHLGDAIGPDGLTFDYHLTPGPATSRNAIALLKLNGAPESLVSRALDRAAILDKQRQLQSS